MKIQMHCVVLPTIDGEELARPERKLEYVLH